jgi:hypothetical protein
MTVFYDHFKKIQHLQVPPGSTGTTLDGWFTAGTNFQASGGSTTKIWDSDGGWVRYRTGSTINTSSGVRASTSPANGASGGGVQIQSRPTQYLVIKTDTSVENIQLQAGMTSNDPTSPDATQHEAKFFYDTSVHGTEFWRCVTDNDSGSPEVTVTTIPVLPDTKYKLKIDAETPGSILFYVSDVLVATHSTVLPDSGEYITHLVTVKNRAAAIKGIFFGRSYIETE